MSRIEKSKIIFFTKYTNSGPSSRYRSYQYSDYFKKEFDIVFHPFFDDLYILNMYNNKKTSFLKLAFFYLRRVLHVFKYLWTNDIIFIEYELLPYFPPFFEFLLTKTNVKYVLDYDDAIFHNYDQHKNRIIRLILKNKISKIAKNSTYVITGSPYLTNYFTNFTSNVLEIPTSIIFNRYKNAHKKISSKKNIIIGWIGSKSTSINILEIKDAILKISEEHSNVFFKFMGFDKGLTSNLISPNISFHNWSSSEELLFLNSIDIGIMPLDLNDFNNGKCGFKLIQYMAMGKVTISTPLEANVKINRHNNNLFANNNKEWIDSLNYFILNYNKLNIVGSQNLEIVKKYYCVESNFSNYTNLFKKILDVRN